MYNPNKRSGLLQVGEQFSISKMKFVSETWEDGGGNERVFVIKHSRERDGLNKVTYMVPSPRGAGEPSGDRPPLCAGA